VANDKVDRLLEAAGSQTYAEAAGIHLADEPAPLYQLLMLTVLLSHRIGADIAVDAARELIEAGATTAQNMTGLSWQQRVDAEGRAHFKRYDESTATRLGESAQQLIDRYDGDLRRLAEAAGRDRERANELLQEFVGIGPLGADIFLREAQTVWTWLQPYLGKRAGETAAELGIPHTERGLAEAIGDDDLAHVTAALIRYSTDSDVRERLKSS
jgi:endonuclease III